MKTYPKKIHLRAIARLVPPGFVTLICSVAILANSWPQPVSRPALPSVPSRVRVLPNRTDGRARAAEKPVDRAQVKQIYANRGVTFQPVDAAGEPVRFRSR